MMACRDDGFVLSLHPLQGYTLLLFPIHIHAERLTGHSVWNGVLLEELTHGNRREFHSSHRVTSIAQPQQVNSLTTHGYQYRESTATIV